MKIRTDFVTNSSSSSFVAYRVEGRALTDYIKSLVDAGKAGSVLRTSCRGEWDRLYDGYCKYPCSYLAYLRDGSLWVDIEKHVDEDFLSTLLSFFKLKDVEQEELIEKFEGFTSGKIQRTEFDFDTDGDGFSDGIGNIFSGSETIYEDGWL